MKKKREILKKIKFQNSIIKQNRDLMKSGKKNLISIERFIKTKKILMNLNPLKILIKIQKKQFKKKKRTEAQKNVKLISIKKKCLSRKLINSKNLNKNKKKIQKIMRPKSRNYQKKNDNAFMLNFMRFRSFFLIMKKKLYDQNQ